MINSAQFAERNPVQPHVEVTLQSGGRKFGGHPLHVKGHICRSRSLHEQGGRRGAPLPEAPHGQTEAEAQLGWPGMLRTRCNHRTMKGGLQLHSGNPRPDAAGRLWADSEMLCG